MLYDDVLPIRISTNDAFDETLMFQVALGDVTDYSDSNDDNDGDNDNNDEYNTSSRAPSYAAPQGEASMSIAGEYDDDVLIRFDSRIVLFDLCLSACVSVCVCFDID